MAQPVSPPELCLVEDVAASFARLAEAAIAHTIGPFRFACSGGSTGRACLDALVGAKVPFERIELFLVDERCVPADDPDSNARSLAESLGEARRRLAGFHSMSCEAGPGSYAAEIASVGGAFDLVQLGMGPDGHTASLFPDSPALEAPGDELVATNIDPSGRNRHNRLTLTYAGIALGELVVIAVSGAEKHEALEAIFAGEDLPVGRVRARRLVWLVDAPAAGGLPTRALPDELFRVTAELTHDAETPALVEQLLGQLGVRRNRDLIRRLVLAALRLAGDDTNRLDLKIVGTALSEMGDAFRMFAPFNGLPKLTIFGSARTGPDSPLYALTRDLAQRMAEAGWMVVTGAGPGIMAAGNEGAGPEMAIGVNIVLPFETEPNPWIASNEKLVDMKYFFTRKLMLMKESTGFCCLPGGFGTQDEAFELLTLVQTGKAEPAPIVLLDTAGGDYWRSWERFVVEQIYGGALADPADANLYCVTDDVETAQEELLRFHRNYHSRRFVNSTMVIRLRHAPSDEEIARLSEEYADICSPKGIWRTEPLGPERASGDHLELARLALEFDRTHHGRLRRLIDALNDLVPSEAPTRFAPASATGTFTGGEGDEEAAAAEAQSV